MSHAHHESSLGLSGLDLEQPAPRTPVQRTSQPVPTNTLFGSITDLSGADSSIGLLDPGPIPGRDSARDGAADAHRARPDSPGKHDPRRSPPPSHDDSALSFDEFDGPPVPMGQVDTREPTPLDLIGIPSGFFDAVPGEDSRALGMDDGASSLMLEPELHSSPPRAFESSPADFDVDLPSVIPGVNNASAAALAAARARREPASHVPPTDGAERRRTRQGHTTIPPTPVAIMRPRADSVFTRIVEPHAVDDVRRVSRTLTGRRRAVATGSSAAVPPSRRRQGSHLVAPRFPSPRPHQHAPLMFAASPRSTPADPAHITIESTEARDLSGAGAAHFATPAIEVDATSPPEVESSAEASGIGQRTAGASILGKLGALSVGEVDPEPIVLDDEAPEALDLGELDPKPIVLGEEAPEALDLGELDPEPIALDEEAPEALDLGELDSKPIALDEEAPEALDLGELDSDTIALDEEEGVVPELACEDAPIAALWVRTLDEVAFAADTGEDEPSVLSGESDVVRPEPRAVSASAYAPTVPIRPVGDDTTPIRRASPPPPPSRPARRTEVAPVAAVASTSVFGSGDARASLLSTSPPAAPDTTATFLGSTSLGLTLDDDVDAGVGLTRIESGDVVAVETVAETTDAGTASEFLRPTRASEPDRAPSGSPTDPGQSQRAEFPSAEFDVGGRTGLGLRHDSTNESRTSSLFGNAGSRFRRVPPHV